ncbi:hypothetical protein ARALYDRAFT_354569 [Arabidopsis lyrata subsp. lyrata]|uniref:Phospholipase/carboxylesterase/thioesterase domain-containing protein n=1 Tax=Arabidopsis lyrata subsp. lyrata TaxID=81972 RepID=D7MEA6_ARALL|nr:hypothetical protein ARALYDRAFT_354569 [Arabidopsis lyrata subsp. lyrata]
MASFLVGFLLPSLLLAGWFLSLSSLLSLIYSLTLYLLQIFLYSCSVDVKVYDGSSKDESSLLKAVTNVHAIIDKEIAGEINPENVYICGFSQGGALTLASVLLYPKAFGGGSVFSGWIPFNIWSYGSNKGCRALGIKRQHCTQETETPRSVQDLTTSSKLLTLYAGDLVSSLGLFGELKDKDVIVWNTVGLFVEMIQKGYEFDSTTLLLAASALSTLHLSKKFPMVHCLAIETSLVSDSSLCNALMILYAKGEDLSSTEYGYPRKSLKYFKSMTGSGQEADSVTFSCVISACSSLEKLPLGEPLHGLVIKSGYSPEAEVSVANSIISMYSKCEDAEARKLCLKNYCARMLFLGMQSLMGLLQMECSRKHLREEQFMVIRFAGRCNPDIRDNNRSRLGFVELDMIFAFAQNGFTQEAKNLFKEVFSEYSCDSSDSLIFGKSVHCWLQMLGLGDNILLANSVIIKHVHQLQGPYFSIPAVRDDIGNKGSHILELCYRWLRIKWSPFKNSLEKHVLYMNRYSFCINEISQLDKGKS